ncbi:MAG: hypothetical protein ACK5B9_00800 [Flavobacteriia bacterium]|jgi:hypothetical protein
MNTNSKIPYLKQVSARCNSVGKIKINQKGKFAIMPTYIYHEIDFGVTDELMYSKWNIIDMFPFHDLDVYMKVTLMVEFFQNQSINSFPQTNLFFENSVTIENPSFVLADKDFRQTYVFNILCWD